MSKWPHILLTVLLCAALPVSLSAAGKRPADAWVYYHFDGASFAPGPATDGSAYIAVQEKVRPTVLTTPVAQPELTALPENSGVIAGICYLQNSGGKLGGGSGYKPYPRVPLLISTGGTPFVTIQTDDHGYFISVLPSGTYTIGSGPASAELAVEPGITTLVPLRAGKRMVD